MLAAGAFGLHAGFQLVEQELHAQRDLGVRPHRPYCTPVSSLIPRDDDEFDRGPTHPARPQAPGYDPDFARAEEDRGSYGLVSAAYWVARGVQGLLRAIRRR